MVQQPPPGVMHQLKEQLEERTRVLQDDIKTQQHGLHHIKEQLQLLQMLLQKPPQGLSPVQQVQAGPSIPQQGGVIRQGIGPSKHPIAGQQHHSLSTTSVQVQRSVGSVRMQSHSSLTTSLYSVPAPFPQTSTCPSMQGLSQRHPDPDFSSEAQLRMLLNQPIQSLAPDSSMSAQASPCNMVLQQAKYTVDQQAMSSLPQLSCSALIVPPIMITPQTQHPIHLQQQHYFQMPAPGMQTQAFFHTTPVPQQSTMGYLQPQQQLQQQQRHLQNQTGNLSNMQLPR
ncbi:hypothetical protein AAFF_G00013790 [Aldrovandia affinis]|uniref:Neuronal PAS domain-containing protein 2-like n=1 Tax=Aldrovandia affinis TaxID=143900 RepID=A0AAD7WHG4_9TELE|nr:hypothetical protein AAFF_G00013790 [Aldrovandia affinis]